MGKKPDWLVGSDELNSKKYNKENYKWLPEYEEQQKPVVLPPTLTGRASAVTPNKQLIGMDGPRGILNKIQETAKESGKQGPKKLPSMLDDIHKQTGADKVPHVKIEDNSGYEEMGWGETTLNALGAGLSKLGSSALKTLELTGRSQNEQDIRLYASMKENAPEKLKPEFDKKIEKLNKINSLDTLAAEKIRLTKKLEEGDSSVKSRIAEIDKTLDSYKKELGKDYGKELKKYADYASDYYDKKLENTSGAKETVAGIVQSVPQTATGLINPAVFLATSYGSYADEAAKEGATPEQQGTYGYIGGMTEAATEAIPFDMIKKTAAGKYINEGAKTFIGKYGKQGLKMLAGAGTEAAQEALTSPIMQTAKKNVYDSSVPLTDLKDENGNIIKQGIFSLDTLKQDITGGAGMYLLLGALGLSVNKIGNAGRRNAAIEAQTLANDIVEGKEKATAENMAKLDTLIKTVDPNFSLDDLKLNNQEQAQAEPQMQAEPQVKATIENVGQFDVAGDTGDAIVIVGADGEQHTIRKAIFDVVGQIETVEAPPVEVEQSSQNIPGINSPQLGNTNQLNTNTSKTLQNDLGAVLNSEVQREAEPQLKAPQLKNEVPKVQIYKHREVSNTSKDSALPYIENRTMENVGDKEVKSYQYLHPQIKEHVQQEANIILGEVEAAIKGEKDSTVTDAGERLWSGTKKLTSQTVQLIQDETGMTYDQIKNSLKRIIEDHGRENTKNAKKIELIIDQRLSEGYTDFNYGQDIPPNEEYLRKKANIERGKATFENIKTFSGTTEATKPKSVNYKQKDVKAPEIKKAEKEVAASTQKEEVKISEKEKQKAEQLVKEATADLKATRKNKVRGERGKDYYVKQGFTGLGIDTRLIKQGRVDLRGEVVKSAEDVAILAQIFRDPRFETMRFIYVKGNTIVGHEGVTTRLPNTAKVFVGEFDKGLEDMQKKMERLGADGYYLLHNHPSGIPEPSPQDLNSTGRIASAVKGLKGHIIINSNKYAEIQTDGKTATYSINDLYLGKDKLLSPMIDNPMLGEKIMSGKDLSSIAKQMQLNNDMKVIVYVDAKLRVRAIQDVPNGIFNSSKSAADYIRGRAGEFGASEIFVVSNDHSNKEVMKDLIKNNIALDVIVNGNITSWREQGIDPEKRKGDLENFGKEYKAEKIQGVKEEKEQYSITNTPAFKKWFGDSKVVDEKGEPLRVFHGTANAFDTFDTKTLGKTTQAITAKLGIFFTDNAKVANVFAKKHERDGFFAYTKPDGGNIMPVYLSIKNPLVFKKQMFGDPFSDFKQYLLDTANKINTKYQAKSLDDIYVSGLVKYLKENYDGIIIENTRMDSPDKTPSNFYIAFEPTQIKSATGNNGDFDSSNPSIVKEDSAEYKTIEKEAIKHFGTTSNFKEAGYLTLSGKLLDFSGKKDGGQPGTRSMDHRDISDMNDYEGPTMDEFMDMGNIRMKPEGYGFELTQKPTSEQITVLKRYINSAYGEVYVDLGQIGKHNTTPEYVEYPKGTKADRVINDINRFYDEGSINKSTLADFHNSVYEDNLAYETGREKDRQFIANSLMNSDAVPQEIKDYFADHPELIKYVQHSNKKAEEEAARRVDIGFNDEVARIKKLTVLESDLDTAIAIEIGKRYIQTGEFDRAANWQLRISKLGTETGRAIQYFSMLKKYSADWTLKHVQTEITKANSKTKNDILRDRSKELSDGLQGLNDGVLEDVIKKIKDKARTKEILDTTAEQTKLVDDVLGPKDEKQNDAADKLANRVENQVKPPKEKVDSALNDMVKTLFDVAKQVLPEKERPTPKNAMDFITKAMLDKEGYKKVWQEAQKIVKGKFEGQQDMLDVLDNYFSKYLDKPFSEKQIEKAVKKGLKDNNIDLDNLVRKHYTEVEATGKSLSEKLIENGMPEHLAKELQGYIIEEFNKQTALKKKQIIERTFKEKAIGKNKQLFEKIIELSNLGAFDEDTFRGLVAKKYGMKALTKEAAQKITEMANEIQELKEGREKNKAIGRLTEFMEEQIGIGFLRKLNTYQTINMLANSTTAIRNISSNFIFAMVDSIRNDINTGLDFATTWGSGKRTATVVSPSHFVSGMYDGWKEAWADFVENVNTKNIGSNERMQSSTELKSGRTFKKGLLGQAERVMRLLLDDRVWENAHFKSEMARQKKLARLNNVEFNEADAIEKAAKLAEKNTFNDTNILSKHVVGIKREMNLGKAWGAGDVALKFAKVPANLVVRQVEYSPLNFLRQLGIASFEGAKYKTFNREAFLNSLSKAITGTAVIGLGIFLYKLGVMTLDRDKDKDAQAFNEQTGYGKFKLNLSAIWRKMTGEEVTGQEGDMIISYDWMTPFGQWLAVGGTMSQSHDKPKGEKALTAAANYVESLNSGLESTFNQPMLQGIKSLFSKETIMEGVTTTIAGTANTFVPMSSTLNQFKKVSDNKVRETYNADMFKETGNKILARLPVLSKKLPEKIDTLGRTKDVNTDFSSNYYLNMATRVFNSFFNPALVTKQHTTDEEKVIQKIIGLTGDKTIYPRVASKTMDLGEDGTIDLTPEEYVAYQKFIGANIAKYIRENDMDILTNENLTKEDYEKRAKAIKSQMDDLNTIAKKTVSYHRGLKYHLPKPRK